LSGYIIGTDEAGYGPNLGPLVVSATLWRTPDGMSLEEMEAALKDVVRRSPRKDDRKPERPCVADSKVLYKSSGSLAPLERSLFPFLIMLGRPTDSWRTLMVGLDPKSASVLEASTPLPWHDGFDHALPWAAKPDMIDETTVQLTEDLKASGIELLDIRSRLIFPEEFNSLLDHYDSKGALLSHATLALVAELTQSINEGKGDWLGVPDVTVPLSRPDNFTEQTTGPDSELPAPASQGDAANKGDRHVASSEPVPFISSPKHTFQILCDKHGGRNKYRDLLEDHFPDHFIEIRSESRAKSVYRFGPSSSRYEVRFEMKADSRIPPALASIASKYLRELAMEAENAYWIARREGLRPTAGYPQDAKRFVAEIRELIEADGLDRRLYWRER
jgi:ribonuclease HII